MRTIFKVIACFLVVINLYGWVFAADYEIIPEGWDVTSQVDSVWEKAWKVWETYNSKASSMSVWDQMASWIMTWNTILEFIVHLVRFLSQLALVIWAIMIIYAWYLYGLSVFNWWNVSKGSKAIQNAILWILIVIFSFSIMKIITSMFLK